MKLNNKVGMRIILLLSIILLITLSTLVYLYVDDRYINHSSYINLDKRDSYLIQDAQTTTLSSLVSTKKNENTLVVFWASWCHYCVEESKDLNQFILDNPNTTIIVVSHDTNKEELESFLSSNQYRWYVIFDSQKTIRESIHPGASGIPSFYLVDRNLALLRSYKGNLTLDNMYRFMQNQELTENEKESDS